MFYRPTAHPPHALQPGAPDCAAGITRPEVHLPDSPASGVKILAGGVRSVTIGLPQASRLGRGHRVDPMAVVFRATDQSFTVEVQDLGDGTARTVLLIESPAAPASYRFPVQVPRGASLDSQPDGSVRVIGVDGCILGGFDAPWAFDANGSPVRTYFEIDGTTLVQHVRHSGAAYPVIADPRWRAPDRRPGDGTGVDAMTPATGRVSAAGVSS